MHYRITVRNDYLFHGDDEGGSRSRYKGGFVKKNGRSNNSKEYNHDYYVNNKDRWKKVQSRRKSRAKDLENMGTGELYNYSKQVNKNANESYDRMSEYYDDMIATGVTGKHVIRGEQVTSAPLGANKAQQNAIDRYNSAQATYQRDYDEKMRVNKEIRKRGNNTYQKAKGFFE